MISPDWPATCPKAVRSSMLETARGSVFIVVRIVNLSEESTSVLAHEVRNLLSNDEGNRHDL